MYSIYILCILVFAQYAFSEENSVTNIQNKDERQPFYAPGMCPENQIYYPGEKETDWVCDCAPRFVYYQDKCYHVYKRGPCKANEYLILKKPENIPECIRNPCMNDTLVPFNGECVMLHTTNGCPPLHLGGGTLEVNASTLELECVPANAAELKIAEFPCKKGKKRNSDGKCRKVFNPKY